jgi:hypothetical protein
MYTGAMSKDMAHSLIDAMERFHSFKQSSHMDNATYLRTFQSHFEAIDDLDGGFGIHMLYIETRIKNAGGDPDDVTDWTCGKDEVQEEFFAKYFLLKSNPRRYGSLVASVQNDFISRQDMYPTTLTKAYDMIVNSSQTGGNRIPGAWYVLLSGGRGRISSTWKRTSWSWHTCSRSRTRSWLSQSSASWRARGTSRRNDEENYPLEEEYEDEVGRPVNDPSNNTGCLYSVVLCTNAPTSLSSHTSVPTTHEPAPVAQTNMSEVLFNMCATEQIVLQQHTLPAGWLLLDSCSTIDIVSNASLLRNIHSVECPNAGQVQLDHQGYLGDYPYPVWYSPEGVANILSLNNVASKY